MIKTVQNKIAYIKNKAIPILKKYNVIRAGLFGSVVRGEENLESDIDFLVKFADEADISLMEIAGLKVDLEEIFERKVDLVEYDAIKQRLKSYILPEEVRIYEKR